MQFRGPSPVTRDSCDCNQPLRATDADGNDDDKDEGDGSADADGNDDDVGEGDNDDHKDVLGQF